MIGYSEILDYSQQDLFEVLLEQYRRGFLSSKFALVDKTFEYNSADKDAMKKATFNVPETGLAFKVEYAIIEELKQFHIYRLAVMRVPLGTLI